MKIFIIILLFSTSSFACQFAPLECSLRTAHFDLKKVQSLEEKVERYHNYLLRHSHPVNEMNSCFNSGFSVMHLRNVQKEIKRYGKTCMEYRWRITASVKELVNPGSLENRSIDNEAVKEKLQELAEEINAEVKDI
jgi:hypothetical protein